MEVRMKESSKKKLMFVIGKLGHKMLAKRVVA